MKVATTSFASKQDDETMGELCYLPLSWYCLSEAFSLLKGVKDQPMPLQTIRSRHLVSQALRTADALVCCRFYYCFVRGCGGTFLQLGVNSHTEGCYIDTYPFFVSCFHGLRWPVWTRLLLGSECSFRGTVPGPHSVAINNLHGG